MKSKVEINKEFTNRYRKYNLENSDSIYSNINLNSLKTCSVCKLFLKKSEFGRNITGRDGFNNRCKSCFNSRNRELYSSDPSKNQKKKQYRQENPEIYQRASLKYYHANSEKQNANNKKWLANNTWYVNEQSALKRTARRKATPSWVDRQELKRIYKEARKLSETTGIKYQVDHIIPLVNKNVCGLHIPSNLRIITAEENLAKSNKFSQEMYEQILEELK